MCARGVADSSAVLPAACPVHIQISHAEYLTHTPPAKGRAVNR